MTAQLLHLSTLVLPGSRRGRLEANHDGSYRRSPERARGPRAGRGAGESGHTAPRRRVRAPVRRLRRAGRRLRLVVDGTADELRPGSLPAIDRQSGRARGAARERAFRATRGRGSRAARGGAYRTSHRAGFAAARGDGYRASHRAGFAAARGRGHRASHGAGFGFARGDGFRAVRGGGCGVVRGDGFRAAHQSGFGGARGGGGFRTAPGSSTRRLGGARPCDRSAAWRSTRSRWTALAGVEFRSGGGCGRPHAGKSRAGARSGRPR